MSGFLRPLQAEKLFSDPRVAKAKQILREAVEEHQQKITGVRPAHADRLLPYQQILQEFASCRGAPLFYPYLGSGIGKGTLVELVDGSVKYDLITGIGVHYWGHSHPKLIEVGIEAAISDTVMQGHLQQNQESLALSKTLLKASGMDHCFLTSSGVMANENALKIAFQKKHPASRVLAFSNCFTGRSLYFCQVTDKPAFRKGMPLTAAVDYVPFFDYRRPGQSIEYSLKVLRRHLQRYPKQHAAMIFELIQGEAGFYPGTSEFFIALMEELKRHNVAVIVDEVQTFGRTPQLFSYQYFGIEKYVDIATIGKLSHTCATLFRQEMNPEPGLLSQTFISSTFALRASHLIIESLLEEGYFGPEGKIAHLHGEVVEELEKIAQEMPDAIHGPYGIGCMVAFTPFDGTHEQAFALAHRLFVAGIISFIAGQNPTRIRFLLPAGALTSSDIVEVMRILRSVLSKGKA